MSQIIYYFIRLITKLHAKFLSINDTHGLDLSDKQLHFLIIGMFGFCMLLIIQPLFKWFAKHDGIMFVTFTYVFTVVLVISFGIEIGQAYSGTGDMDFYDIAYGLMGFFVFFIIYLIIYMLYHQFLKYSDMRIRKSIENRNEAESRE